jgi:ABC-type branched-subunit amino acid transport system ATPase component
VARAAVQPGAGECGFSLAVVEPAASLPVLSAQRIVKNFDGVKAVRQVSFELAPREVLGIIGQNGSGKTTLINVITGFYPPTSGSVLFDRRDITGWPLARIARLGISRTFQNLRLFEGLTALDNVLLGMTGRQDQGVFGALFPFPAAWRKRRQVAEKALALMDRLGIANRAKNVVKDLSHGDRRRLEIARALISDPAVVVLDEPTAGLTPAEGDKLIGVLRSVPAEGRAVLIIEHNLRVVGEVADEVLIMHAGAPLARGPLRDLLANEAIRDAYFGVSR